MKKNIIYIILNLLLLSYHTFGQTYHDNHIENGDFDSYTSVPDNHGQIFKATGGWTLMNNHSGTPDFFHEDASAISSVQLTLDNCTNFFYPRNVNARGCNGAGVQEPVKGRGYIGFLGIQKHSPCNDNFETEYIQNEMSLPLLKGVKYKVSMKVSHAEEAEIAHSNIGMLVTKERPLNPSCGYLSGYNPQVLSNIVIKEQDEWVLLEGEFIAEGGEKWLTIGVFEYEDLIYEELPIYVYSNNISNTSGSITHTKRIRDASYYFIDDVKIEEIDLCEQPCFDVTAPILINGWDAETAILPNQVIPNNQLFRGYIGNATHYKLTIRRRNGFIVYEEEGEDLCGFDNKEFAWNGFNNGICAPYTHIAKLELSNCSQNITRITEVIVSCNGESDNYISPTYTSICETVGGNIECCVDEWVLENETINKKLALSAENRIITNNVDIILPNNHHNNMVDNKHVIFKAGNYLHLKNTSIQVDSETSFSAMIDDCASVTYSPLLENEEVFYFSDYKIPNRKKLISSIPNYKIDCFPNPFDKVLKISLNKLVDFAEITIYSLDGRNVYTNHFKNLLEAEINLSYLSSGIYLITLSNETITLKEKIVKLN